MKTEKQANHFFSDDMILKIKNFESDPVVIKNCFSKEEIYKLLTIERNSKYLVDRVDGRKAGLANDGSIAERNISNWNEEIKDIILDKIDKALGSFNISETEFPPHFFTVNFPTRIHADTGRDKNSLIYKQIMIPINVAPQNSSAHTILFKNRWYGSASFFVGKNYKTEENSNQGHIKDVNGEFIYIDDLNKFLEQVKMNMNYILKFNSKEYLCNNALLNDIKLLKEKRYNLVTSSHITENKKFDFNIYKDYLSHHSYEDLYDLEVSLIYKWNIGDMLVWDRSMLHSSDNYVNIGGSQKTGLAIFTCK